MEDRRQNHQCVRFFLFSQSCQHDVAMALDGFFCCMVESICKKNYIAHLKLYFKNFQKHVNLRLQVDNFKDTFFHITAIEIAEICIK